MVDTVIDNDLKTMQQVAECGYEPIERKGQGSYGLVYEVSDVNGNIFAFKYILPDVTYKTSGLDSLNEIDILTRVQHPNIIHAAKIITSHTCNIDGLAVVLPLADRTLYDMIRDVRATTEVKLPILFKLASAMQFMHQSGILHLDIKSTNVVLQGINTNIPYFIDFGLSMVVDDATIGKYNSSARVTIDHRAPEILEGGRIYNAAVDVWSFGIMMLYLLAGQNIYKNVDFNKVTPLQLRTLITATFSTPAAITELLSVVREQYRGLCIDLISRILVINPALRLTSTQICNHPIFDGFRVPIQGSLIYPPIYYDYAPDHRDILKLLIHWARELYAESRVELLFLAVDLFNRMGSYYKTQSSIQRMSLAGTCLWVAAKLTNDKLITLDVYVPALNRQVTDITINSILEDEINIVHTLEGILDVSRLYRICSNADELDLSLQHIILDKDSTLYARVDIPLWSQKMKELTPNPTPRDKNIKISAFI